MRILVIRRDNIGDLVCTTPLFSALRARFPQAWIGALVNSYNAAVLERNPDVTELIAYTKLKHLAAGESAVGAWTRRLAGLWKLRRMRLDAVVLATTDFAPRTFALARALAPKEIVGYSDGSARAASLHRSLPVARAAGQHEVERVHALAGLFGAPGLIPPLRLVPDPAEVERARAALSAGRGDLKIALHLSARRPAQRWQAEKFVALAKALTGGFGATVMLLWSPGPKDHPEHPGDDEKAARVLEEFPAEGRVIGYPTARLQQLIGALAACDGVICADGGASHLAAALGKPLVCFFGDSPVARWRPWGVPQRILQAPSRQVSDISFDDALAAFGELARQEWR